jgi:hypothetical protein
VLLKYTEQPFRTYSTSSFSGGGSSITSDSGGGETATSSTNSSSIDTSTTTQDITVYGTSLTTNSSDGSVGAHSHSISSHSHNVLTAGHWHTFTFSHDHSVEIPSHSHRVAIPDHFHGLNFGIKEQEISDYAMDIYVDGVLRQTITNSASNAQGIIDLTAYITTTGWHTIEIRSTTLKRVSAQVNIKSYIRS